MRRMLDRLTYANVVATLALFLVLAGGSALAAKHFLPKNSVGTKQIKNNAITGAKVRNGALTGAKLKLSTLGTVPSATHADNATRAVRAAIAGDSSTLQGNPPSAFMQGGGRFFSFHRELAPGTSGVTVMALPGLGTLNVECQMGTKSLRGGFEFINQSGGPVDQTNHYGQGIDGGTVGNGGKLGFGQSEVIDAVTIGLATRSEPAVVANLNLSFVSNGSTGCELFGQATVGGAS